MTGDDIDEISTDLLCILDDFKITSAEPDEYNYISDESLQDYWREFLGIGDGE